MSIDTPNQASVQLQQVIVRAQAGVRDPAAVREGVERMDRMREELRKKMGSVDVAVELIRDARNP